MNTDQIQNILNSYLGTGYINSNEDSVHSCPFCKHHKKKLQINLKTQLWHCWVCNARGKTLRSLFRQLKAPARILDEISKLFPKKSKTSSYAASEIDISVDVVELPKEFRSLAVESNSFLYKKCINYLNSRGITLIDIIKYNIGYCLYGDYANMIILPSYDKYNKLNFFTGHSFDVNSRVKFKNPKFSRNVIGFESTIAFSDPIILVESPIDAITVGRNAIPLFGKTISDELKTFIIESNINVIYVCLDGDALKAAISHCEYLNSIGKIVKFIELEEDKDPNDLGHIEIWKKIRKSIEMSDNNLFSYKLKIALNEKNKKNSPYYRSAYSKFSKAR